MLGPFYGIGDELRWSFVAGVTYYWGAAAFLRDSDRPWSTEDNVPCSSPWRPSTGSPRLVEEPPPGRRRSRGRTAKSTPQVP